MGTFRTVITVAFWSVVWVIATVIEVFCRGLSDIEQLGGKLERAVGLQAPGVDQDDP